jgi:hypothetical protein
VERWGRRRIWRKTSEGGSGGVRGAAAGRGGRRREDLGFCVCVWGGGRLYIGRGGTGGPPAVGPIMLSARAQ